MLSRVVLPAPDGPTMATNSPGPTVSASPWSATAGGLSNALRSMAIRIPPPPASCVCVLTAPCPGPDV